MFAMLGGTRTPYSQGRADGDDEASTESQESRVRSMELLVQSDEDYATPPRSVSSERQSREVPKWDGRVERCAVGYIRDQEGGTKD